MRHKTPALQWTRPRSVAALGLSILLLLSTASLSQAQSGRRPPKQPTAPDPLPPKQEEPPAKQSSDQDSKSRIPVKVVWGLQNINASTIYSRIVEDGCMERLSKSGSVRATPAADMNRKQAHDIAKGSTDTYVLWFELEVDVADTDRAALGGVPAQYLYVRYEVFTPGTGKTKTSGRVYQRRVGPGGVPLPRLPRTTGSAEYSLRYVGREMADRLLDTLNLPRPSERN